MTYLALGDSYTIGEGVPVFENFPNKAVQLLRKKGLLVNAPDILAKTGWTTDELQAAINETIFLEHYDIVSLLIGVNNQYRGRTVENFETEFVQLVSRAIQFAGNQADHVVVISIPDWGITPFAEGRDRAMIASQINDYNSVCKLQAEKMGCNFIDITESQREDGSREDFLVTDKLHPSGIEYQKWAEKVAAWMHAILSKQINT